MRIHYFFTENYSIESFINNTIIEVRLTDGEDWKNIIAEGKLHLKQVDQEVHYTQKMYNGRNLPHFGENEAPFDPKFTIADIIKMENINIYMFCLNEEIDPFYLKTKASYKFDQEIQTENLDLWKYNSVFFPDNEYFNSNSLPIEWLEMFEVKEELGKPLFPLSL